MAPIEKQISGAAFRLSRKYGAELNEVVSRLSFFYHNAEHHSPFNPSRGISRSDYEAILLQNAAHRVVRSLMKDKRRQSAEVPLDGEAIEAETLPSSRGGTDSIIARTEIAVLIDRLSTFWQDVIADLLHGVPVSAICGKVGIPRTTFDRAWDALCAKLRALDAVGKEAVA